MKSKNIARRLVLGLLVLAMLIPLVTSVMAYPQWNGTGSGGGSATSSAGGSAYAIPYDTATKNIVGYRFTGLTANGRRANNAPSLDIFVAGKESFLTSGLWHRVRAQYNKYEYRQAFDITQNDSSATPLDEGTTTSQLGAIKESAMGFASKLPSSSWVDDGQIDEKMEEWQSSGENLDKVAKKIGYKNGTSSMGPNDKIIVEPIFAIRLDGVNFCMTASDIAWFGYTYIFNRNADSNGRRASNNGEKGTWYFTSKFTNRNFPNILYTAKEDGVGGLWEICPSGGIGSSSYATFRTLLSYGYGVGICYQNKVTKPDLEAVDIICEVQSGTSWIRINPQNIPCGATYRIKLVYRNNRTGGSALTNPDDVVLWFGDNTSGNGELTVDKMTPFTIDFNTVNGTWYYSKDKYTYSQNTYLDAITTLLRTGADQEIYWTKSGTNRDFTAPSSPDSGSWQIAIWMHVPESNFKDGNPTNQGWDFVSKSKEGDVTNNRYQVSYAFQYGSTSHDVAITNIKYYNKPIENGGTEYSKDSSGRYLIPYGATVYVYHNYKNNSNFGLYVNGYENTTGRNVLYNGEKDIYIAAASTVSNVLAGTFTANSFSFTSRPGMVYVSGKGSASGESNTSNNKKSVSWKAYIDLELEKIELRSTTNANTILDPNNIPEGSNFTVYYTFKNNSALAIENAATYKKNDFTNALGTYYIAEKGYIDEEGNNLSKILVKGDTYSNVTASGSVSGAICVSGDTSLSYELSGTRANNKKSLSYTVVAKKDLEVQFIQYAYVYTAPSGESQTVTQTVYRGTNAAYETNMLPVFPYGATVTVYAQFANNTSGQVTIDGYYTKGSGSQTAMNNAVTVGGVDYPSATNYSLSGNSTQKFCIGTFTANTLGRSNYSVAVYMDGKKDAADEVNTGNNVQTSNYRVFGDVAVTNIYFKQDGAIISEPAKIAFGSSYEIWATVRNNTPRGEDIDIWYQHEGSSSATKVRTNVYIPASSSAGYKLVSTTAGYSSDEFAVVAMAYFTGKTSAAGECSEYGSDMSTNNTRTENYRIYGDVGIELYFTGNNDNKVDPAEFWHTQEYKVWLTAINNTTCGQKVNVYYKGNKVIFDSDGDGAGDTSELYLEASTSYSFVVEAPKGANLPEKLGDHTVDAAIYFKDQTTAEGETDASGNAATENNTATGTYKIKAEVGIKDVIYKDENGVVISDPSKIKEGTKVKVYYVCTNAASVDVSVWLKYNGSKCSSQATLPAGTTGTEIFVTEFIADVDESHEIKGEVYRVVFDSAYENATGEIDPNNNVFESSYNVIFYDVEIVDIYYKASGSDERIGLGETSTVLEYGTKYLVYYRIRNNGTEPILIHIYKGLDPKNGDTECVTQSTYATTGYTLAVGKDVGLFAGYLYPNEQVLGEKEILGSVFAVDDEGRTLERTYENNAREESYVFKHNVSLDEIYLTAAGTNVRFTETNADGRIMIPANTNIDIHYVLTNHSGKAITVNIYDYNKAIRTVGIGKNKNITIPANGTVDVVLSESFSASSQPVGGKYYWAGYVYRAGYAPEADPHELTFEDNYFKVRFTTVETPYLEFINPNAPYREGTDVITSYYLYNPTSDVYDGINNTASVHFTVKVKKTGEIIYETTQSAVVPNSCSTKERAQLVYFKWSVPEDYLKDTDRFEVCAELSVSKFPGMNVSVLSNVQDYVTNDPQFTPDTKYEAKEPDGWTKPNKPAINDKESVSWMVWTYSSENKTFTQNEYGIELSAGHAKIKPTSVTSFNERGQYYMKSGYGVQIYHIDEYLVDRWQVEDDMVTPHQYAYMIWPEFQYSREDGCISTLELVDGEYDLLNFLDYGRVHWTPIWFPDGPYKAYACFSDLWTPMGMITVRSQANSIIIDGNMYQDWYIGHG